MVYPSENADRFFEVRGLKLFIVRIKKNAGRDLFATSTGLYYSREGQTPSIIPSLGLFERYEKGQLDLKSLALAFKLYDMRLFSVMTEKIESSNCKSLAGLNVRFEDY